MTLPTARKTAVLIFGRRPQAENKRLGLCGVQARSLHRRLFQRSLDLARCASKSGGPIPIEVVIASDKSQTSAEPGCAFIEQKGHGFQSRLLHSIERTFSLGYDRVVVIGTDTPSLSVQDLVQACTKPGITIGPSTDGGVYLLTVDRGMRHLLRGLPWCSRHLARSLQSRLLEAGFRIHARTLRRDLDSEADLLALRSYLRIQRLLDDGIRLTRIQVPECASMPSSRTALFFGPDRAPPVAVSSRIRL